MNQANYENMDFRKMKTHRSTDLIVREDILQKAKELAELLSTSEEVRLYQKAEEQIRKHEKIQQMIKQIKKKQQEAVAFEHFQNPQMVKKIEAEMEEIQNELDSIPLVQQFQQLQSDINYLLQLVVNVIRDTLAKKINVETGTDDLRAN